MSEGISGRQRFTAEHPCPVCGGHKELPQGQGERCKGYISNDRRWAWCSREEYANGIVPNENGDYRHSLFGNCRCGQRHAAPGETNPTPATPVERGRPKRQAGTLVNTIEYDVHETWGDLLVRHIRKEYIDPEYKDFAWFDPKTNEFKLPVPQNMLPFYNCQNLNGAKMVIVCEGEKATNAVNNALRASGDDHRITAVGWIGGATTFPKWHGLSALQKCYSVVIWPDNDDDGKRLGQYIARKMTNVGIPDVRRIKVDDLPEKADAADLSPEEVIERIRNAEIYPRNEQRTIMLEKVSDIAPLDIEWMWEGYIPYAGITMLDGDPGAGKTGVALSIVARATKGELFPVEVDQKVTHDPISAIYISGDDSPARSIRPRLEGFGADLERVQVLRFTEEKDGKRIFNFEQDREQLEETLDQDPSIRLIVIDPIQLHIGRGLNLNDMMKMREALEPLAIMAEERNIAIVIVRHFIKSSGERAMMHKGGGSVDITAIARSQLVVFTKELEDEDGEKYKQRFLSREKCNWYKPMPSIKYAITGEPFISWGDTVNKSADEISAPQDREKRDRKMGEAQEAILDVLQAHRQDIRVNRPEEEEGLTLEQIATELSKQKSQVANVLRGLVEKGWAIKVRYGVYRIARPGESDGDE